MWRYLKAAFLVGVRLPGLGQMPVNAMAAFAVTALGFVEPSIWLAGLGLEVAFVGSLAFHPRFQKVVDTQTLPRAIQAEAEKRSALVAALPQDLHGRLQALHAASERVLAICRKLAAEPEMIAGTEASLDKLQWIFLKLLIARDHLVNDLGSESETSLKKRMMAIENESATSTGGSPPQAALQRSQMATVEILRQRLRNLNNRDHLLKENESDLARIEAQVALMRENAAIEGKPAAVDTEIEFASDLQSPGLFGAHGMLVRDLDEARSS